MDLLKNQIITMSAMKDNSNNGIISAIYGIILLSIIEQFFKYLPIIGAFIKKNTEDYIKRKYNDNKLINTITNNKKEMTSSIILEKGSKDKLSQEAEYVDSVLEFITKLPNVKFLKYKNKFYISHKEEFEIEKDIYGKCIKMNQNFETGDVEEISIQIYSTTLDIQELRAYLNKIYKNYLTEKKNQLGDQTYFFDYILNSNNNYNNIYFRFDMTPFHTNKTLKTIYGNYMKNIVSRIRFFIENKDWYVKKGIPHTLGLLLHGPPGCGKTSLIKAIAKDTHRHIINIQLNKNMTQNQLKALFFNEELLIFNRKTGKDEIFMIPLDQRIYVMEDVDAISDILYSRELLDRIEKEKKEAEEKEMEKMKEVAAKNNMPAPQKLNEGKSELTLGFILNLLDGILETPGRILILTSNHPEKLDKALVRPGRIDLDIHFDKCTNETIIEMFTKFYTNFDSTELQRNLYLVEDGLLTPAEVNKILFNNYNDSDKALKELYGELRKYVVEDTSKIENSSYRSRDLIDDVLQEICDGNYIPGANEEIFEKGCEEKQVEDVKDEVKQEDKVINKIYFLNKDVFHKEMLNIYRYVPKEFYENSFHVIDDCVFITRKQFDHITKKYRNAILSFVLKIIGDTISLNRMKYLQGKYQLQKDHQGYFVEIEGEEDQMNIQEGRLKVLQSIDVYTAPYNKQIDKLTSANDIDYSNYLDSFEVNTKSNSMDDFFQPLLGNTVKEIK